MPYPSFDSFFQRATGREPFPFQRRLAEGDSWPAVLRAPTGAGKTAAAVLAWVWRRTHPEPQVRATTPRRLVYCLPMRVLVEQTRDAVIKWLKQLELYLGSETTEGSSGARERVAVHTLMGGEVDRDWDLYPERNAVIIGTQDLLLSRALNRGYVCSRFRWPIPFGLLNNDALWVLDEVQLMGAGLPTTAQLTAFRRLFGTCSPCHTMWMSATLDPAWLKTVDYSLPQTGTAIMNIDADDEAQPALRQRLQAGKILRRLPIKASVGSSTYGRKVAQQITRLHQEGRGGRTLVIVNTVQRAQSIYEQLDEVIKPEAILLHSRFRPVERSSLLESLQARRPQGQGQVVIATQVLEAGVDMTSHRLVTELAPWSSMVQRLGRCNRYGEADGAEAYWIDVKDAAPYSDEELSLSRSCLQNIFGDAEEVRLTPSGLTLAEPTSKGNGVPFEEYEILRLKDLRDLFDTAPDLSGNDIDVSRFIRSGEEKDVWVCWREWPKEERLPVDAPLPTRRELCPVPLSQLRAFLGERADVYAWTWDHLDRNWRPSGRGADLLPGQAVVLRSAAGGYSQELGWSVSVREAVPVVYDLDEERGEPGEAGGDDRNSLREGGEQNLPGHTRDVAVELERLLDSLQQGAAPGHGWDLNQVSLDLRAAAELHDLGKAHDVFQDTMRRQDQKGEWYSPETIWAKAPKSDPSETVWHRIPHFRHELASLLALLELRRQGEDGWRELSDLTLYLVAAHHGRVRLKVRSFPGRDGRSRSAVSDDLVLGIKDGDVLPETELGEGRRAPGVRLSLEPITLGDGAFGASWPARTLALLDSELGPFRLAYLEALLRAADIRASQAARGGGN